MKILTALLLFFGLFASTSFANFEPPTELTHEEIEIFSIQDKWISIQLSKFYTAYLEENYDEMARIKGIIDAQLQDDIGKHLGKNIPVISPYNMKNFTRYRPPLNEK